MRMHPLNNFNYYVHREPKTQTLPVAEYVYKGEDSNGEHRRPLEAVPSYSY